MIIGSTYTSDKHVFFRNVAAWGFFFDAHDLIFYRCFRWMGKKYIQSKHSSICFTISLENFPRRYRSSLNIRTYIELRLLMQQFFFQSKLRQKSSCYRSWDVKTNAEMNKKCHFFPFTSKMKKILQEITRPVMHLQLNYSWLFSWNCMCSI